MTVRTQGYVAFGPGDFYRTDRGVAWGIKCSRVDTIEFVGIFVRLQDSTWDAEFTIDDGFDMSAAQYPNLVDWFKEVLIPKLNVWLAAKFPAMTGGVAPPVPMNRLEQADLLIYTRLAIKQNADGTLVAGIEQ